MGRFLALALLAFSLQLSSVWAQAGDAEAAAADIPDLKQTPKLDVTVSTTFANAEIFGIKLVNGKQTEALLSFSNNELEPVAVAFVGGSLWTPDYDPQGARILRNLTTVQYGVQIPAGEKESIPFNIITDMYPGELRLQLAAVVADAQNTFHTISVFNSTVNVVDPDTSIFDPQIIFLYLFLLACFGGVVYFFYTVWVAPYFAPKRGRGSGDRAKKSASKKTDMADAAPGTPADGSAVTTGAKGYNEEWIPAHHIQRPEARRVKSGTPRPKSKGKAE